MRLTPRETDKLLLHLAGSLAAERRERGVLLNYPEAIAFVSSQIMERAREGMGVAQLMSYGRTLLTEDEVMPGVPQMIHEIQIEATFPDGTKLVTVHDPIESANGLNPGEVMASEGSIELNEGRRTVELQVANTADRPIQIGSHFHFFEANRQLRFDRTQAYGMRLNIPSGTAVRFEPGETHEVTLVDLAGTREVYGFNNLVDGPLDDPAIRQRAFERARDSGFLGIETMEDHHAEH